MALGQNRAVDLQVFTSQELLSRMHISLKIDGL
jgi:hypothetical protein